MVLLNARCRAGSGKLNGGTVRERSVLLEFSSSWAIQVKEVELKGLSEGKCKLMLFYNDCTYSELTFIYYLGQEQF